MSECDALFTRQISIDLPQTDIASVVDLIWIQEQLPEGKTIGTRLFKATIDGDAAEDFHSACDDQGMTLVLVEATNGYRFGGFAGKPWSNYSSEYQGRQSLTEGEPR